MGTCFLHYLRRRKLLIFILVLIITFLISTNYLHIILIQAQSEVNTVFQDIYYELERLPDSYKIKEKVETSVFDTFLKHININSYKNDIKELWKLANSWSSTNQLVELTNLHMGSLLLALNSAEIIKADLDSRGTQLKLLLTLEGNQNVVFKPKWYDIDRVIDGPVYAGKDRYNSEIIAFYLSAILNMPFAPCSVERVIFFTQEIIPVATQQLINTSFKVGNRTCIYGKCFYCKKQDPICEDESYSITGAVIFNINGSLKSYRSPWQRTYKKNKKSIWEEEQNYCRYVKQKVARRRLLDLIDVSIFDFLIQNGDRHHYETLHDNVVLLDNGKGFGNPNVTHLDILAPLYQCCLLRNSTLKKLLSVSGGILRKRLQTIPNIGNLLTPNHLKAIEERLLLVFATIEYCKHRKKER